MDILLGIFAIIMVFVTIALKESKNKWLAFIGWAIIILAKILHEWLEDYRLANPMELINFYIAG